MPNNPITFMCQAEVFNGSQCARQCASCKPHASVHVGAPQPSWFVDYEIRTGKDGKVGIYTRDYNCRLATFNANTVALQTRLKLLFDHANCKPVPKVKRRKRRAPAPRGAFSMDIGDNQGWGRDKAK